VFTAASRSSNEGVTAGQGSWSSKLTIAPTASRCVVLVPAAGPDAENGLLVFFAPLFSGERYQGSHCDLEREKSGGRAR
jgi:hypothetical protein